MPSAAYIVGCVCAALAGAFLATQSGINATLGSLAGRSFAAVVSFVVGLAALIIFWLIEVYALGGKGPDRAGVAAVPWWGWIGGFLGAFYVAIVIIFAPVLGAATLMAIFVTAQLSMAVLLDAVGWVGYKQRPLHWGRLLGLALMIGGVALITSFDGSRHTAGNITGFKVAPGYAAVGGSSSSSSAGSGSVGSGGGDAPVPAAVQPPTPSPAEGIPVNGGDARAV